MPDFKNEAPATSPKDMITKSNARSRNKDGSAAKRKCVSTACIACRKRKSKCDGNLPSCAACASVYGTECVYDPNSDHRRKGVYKKGVDSTKTQESTLRILIEGLLNCPEHEVLDLAKQIRTCESLEDVAQGILTRNAQVEEDEEEEDLSSLLPAAAGQQPPRFEKELSGKLGGLRLENGSIQFLGGTSNLLYVDNDSDIDLSEAEEELYANQEEAIKSWTTVTTDGTLILHLIQMYFTWHYSYFTTLSRTLFFRDFLQGRPTSTSQSKTVYCTPLLVNAMLALGCHFTSWPAARGDPEDSATAGDHFFKECKAIIMEHDEYEHARIPTVQALALMSVREAGCGREAKGWIYSGMSFRMALGLGLPYETSNATLSDSETDARRVTFWGCYLFDKCWSNYLGRPPQLALDNITMKKFDVFPNEDAAIWCPWYDTGASPTNSQPARTRAVALQISTLCEISSDLLLSFYRPNQLERPLGKQAELKKLGDLHTRLEAWRKDLPKELEAKEGQLPQVLIMHMFYYLLFIHLFRPFLKYTQSNTPLPPHVSPRRHCTQAAAAISRLLRLYKKTYGLRQICNIAVYIAHSACTIHLLNLQDKDARRDLAHGLKHLEEIADCWLCARRTLNILQQQIRKWEIELPEEAQETLDRVDSKFQLSKIKPDGKPEGESPASEVSALASFTQQVQNFANVNSPMSSSQFDGSLQSPHAHAPVQGHPSRRVRSPSSVRRAELLRQMQQNSLQSQPSHPPQQQQPQQIPRARQYASPAIETPTQHPKWDDEMWKLPNGLQANHPNPLTSKTRIQPPIPTGNTKVAQASVASPTAMFAPPQNNSNSIFEEQRDWWLRDQSSLFDNWTRRNSMSGTGPVTSAAVPANSTTLMSDDVYAGLVDGDINSAAFFGTNGDVAPNMSGAVGGNENTLPVTLPPGWDTYDMLAGIQESGRTGKNVSAPAHGGFNTGIL